MFANPSKVAFFMIFMEMSIHLAYYKDVIFSLSTLVNYGGMYKVSKDLANDPLTLESVRPYALNNKKWLSCMIFINSIFLIMTLFRYWRHSFYLKHWEY